MWAVPDGALSFGGSIAADIFAIVLTIAVLALALREVRIALGARRRVADWRRAGIARQPGEVILTGTAWSDEQGPIATMPVRLENRGKGGLVQIPEGPATTRPFWLATKEGDVAVDARSEVTTLIAPKLPRAPSGHLIREVHVGATLEVYGRLGREHVPGAATEGFRDGGESWSLHGSDDKRLRVAHGGSATPFIAVRVVYALLVLVATLAWAFDAQTRIGEFEVLLFTGRTIHAVTDTSKRDGPFESCEARAHFTEHRQSIRVVALANDAACAEPPGKPIDFVVSSITPAFAQAGPSPHLDDGDFVGIVRLGFILAAAAGASMLWRRLGLFPKR